MAKKTEYIIKGKHLTVTKGQDGKEIWTWDWDKLAEECSKAIAAWEKKNRKK